MSDPQRDLEGKVALVTGSTQGLGAAIAKAFIEAGARVAIAGRSRDKGEALAAALGGQAFFIQADLGQASSCAQLVQEAERRLGSLDVLVNSAADTRRSTLAHLTTRQFDEQFHLNVRAPLLLSQAALPSLRANGGVIINIGSINADIGGEDLLIYSATKGALQTASRNLAHALRQDRVRVYCLNVGWMDSEGERDVQRALGKPDDFLEREGAKTPLGRLVKPDEVAGVCAFLASSRAHAFSGTVIELEQSPVGAPTATGRLS